MGRWKRGREWNYLIKPGRLLMSVDEEDTVSTVEQLLLLMLLLHCKMIVESGRAENLLGLGPP